MEHDRTSPPSDRLFPAPGPRWTCACLLLLPLLGCAKQPRVGIVDVQQAFQRSPLVMVTALELKGTTGGLQRRIKKRGRALAEMQREVRHGGLELPADQRAEIERKIAEETKALVEMQERYREELALSQKQRGEEMIARVEEVAREVARREGLSVLVRKDDAIWVEEGADLSGIDLTEQVIRELIERINPTAIPPPADSPASTEEGR